MSENFRRFKRRAHSAAIIKSVLAAIGAATLLSGVFLFLATHKIINLSPLYSIAVGAFAMVISFAVTFLLLRRSEHAVAREVDARYGLDERVQTMLEYKDESGAIFELQREDANKSLSQITPSGFGMRRLWAFILAAAIGASVLAASLLLIPPKEPPAKNPGDTYFSISDDQVLALELLIKRVSESSMESPYRENVALSLSELLAALKLADTAAERDEALDIAIDEIYEQTDESSSAVEIVNALLRSDSAVTRLLAEAVNYYSWKPDGEWDSYADKLNLLRTAFIHSAAEAASTDSVSMADETRELLAIVGADTVLALSRSQIPESDKLYTALVRFAQLNDGGALYGLSPLASAYADADYAELQVRIDETFAGFRIEIFRALEALRENTLVGEDAMTALSSLFGYKLPKFERPEKPSDSDSEGPSGEGGGGAGAGGEGTVYGSDDLVLDPFTGEYVEYGTLIDRYYSILFNKLQGDYYTAEEKAAMEKYFEILYGGFDKKDN